MLLSLHENAEKEFFKSFHRVCNTLQTTYYHFLGHTVNFRKTFNGMVHEDREINTSNEKRRIDHGGAIGDIARNSIALHVFFHDGKGSQPWDLYPSQNIGDHNKEDKHDIEKLAIKEWDGVGDALFQTLLVGKSMAPTFRHRWYALSFLDISNVSNFVS